MKYAALRSSLPCYALNIVIKNNMIKRSLRGFINKKSAFFFSQNKAPIIFGNGRSFFSLSQLWDGSGEKPFDYFVNDDLNVEVSKEWKLEHGLFRVVFAAFLNDSSMNININHLRKSITLNQLIQLEASEKQKLVDNPSTIIITPNLKPQEEAQENQISKNILELDKLFNQAVGLKVSYMIDANSFRCTEYIEQLKSRDKAISADIVSQGSKFEELIFNNGYKLEHIFLDGAKLDSSQTSGSPFRYNYNLNAVFEALSLINFKGKLILPGGSRYESAVEAVSQAAKVNGFSQKLQFDLETDGWYTMV